jgi:hypothetical protein
MNLAVVLYGVSTMESPGFGDVLKIGFLERSRYYFFQVANQFVLTRLIGPRSSPITS